MFFQCLKNSPARRIGDCLQAAIEGIVVGSHAVGISIKSTSVNQRNLHWFADIGDYFFRIGLYPSPIKRVRVASASLTSVNGPTCTRKSLSVVTGATNA